MKTFVTMNTAALAEPTTSTPGPTRRNKKRKLNLNEDNEATDSELDPTAANAPTATGVSTFENCNEITLIIEIC